jgi:hypothetical protein
LCQTQNQGYQEPAWYPELAKTDQNRKQACTKPHECQQACTKLAPWMTEGLHQPPWMMQASKLAASTLDASKAGSKQELGSFSVVKWNRLVVVISFLFNPETLSILA